jgi:general secretion pathway protein E
MTDFTAVYRQYLETGHALGMPLLVWVDQHYSNPAEQDEVLHAMGAQLGVPYMPDHQLQALHTSYERLTYAEATQWLAAEVEQGGKPLWVVSDPLSDVLFSRLALLSAHAQLFCFAKPDSLAARLRRDEATIRAVDTFSTAFETRDSLVQEDLTLARIAADTSPIIQWVNATIYDAWRIGASDIHYETTASGLQVKCRLDGVLNVLQQIQGLDQAEQMVSRIKVMSELDIAERRIPQDGRFKLQMDGRGVDFRVSVMPSALGEDVVLRVLDKKGVTHDGVISLEGLGFLAEDKRKVHQLAWEPHGMLLVTGPTGSGKTTTLYAVVHELHNTEDKIVTIEDPVEYHLPGVLQIPVNDKKGLTFARGLRSILRHDPDKILVGEIRDTETAQIAIQSALTGHLVLTTVHANNTFDVIGRFSHMGIDLYNFVSALNGVVAQRLIRQNCPHCLQHDSDDSAWLAQLPEHAQIDPQALRKGVGCQACRGAGYKGRTVIAEVLMLDDELRELIIARAPIRALKAHALTRGFESLRSRALALVNSGKTTLNEFVRVVGVRGQ